MVSNKMPKSITAEPNKKAVFKYDTPAGGSGRSSKSKSAKNGEESEKYFSLWKVYNESHFGSVMNWAALYIMVIGAALALMGEVSRSEEVFTETDKSFIKAEVINDNQAFYRKVALGDIDPDQTVIVAETEFASGFDSNDPYVLGTSDDRSTAADRGSANASANSRRNSTEIIADTTGSSTGSVSTTDQIQSADVVTTNSTSVGSTSGQVEGATDQQSNTQDSATTNNVNKEEEVLQLLTSIESNEDKQLAREILLRYPEKTTDKEPEIEFTTSEKVAISTDGEKFVSATSPFTTKILSYGVHDFVLQLGEEGAAGDIAFKILVLPAPPTIDLVTDNKIDENGFVTISGDTEANSEVRVIVASEIQSGVVLSDDFGYWEFTPDRALDSGKHSATAQVTIDGYASDFSGAVEFNVPEHGSVEELPTTASNDIFEGISNETLLMLVVALFLGMIIALLLTKMFSKKEPEVDLKHNGHEEKNHFTELAKKEVSSKDSTPVDMTSNDSMGMETSEDLQKSDSVNQQQTTNDIEKMSPEERRKADPPVSVGLL